MNERIGVVGKNVFVGSIILGLVMACIIVIAGPGSWKYSPSDLSDTGCIQSTIDDIVGGTYTSAAMNVTSLTAVGTVSGADVTASDDVTSGDDVIVGDALVVPVQASTTITNGQVITLSGVIHRLAASGGAALTTNTITLANVDAAGQLYCLVNTSVNTNRICIQQTGNWDGPEISLSANESMFFFAVDTNSFYGIE